jgi:hypothetical protein
MAYTTINKSTDYFNTKLWSGNGSSQALTGVGHQTDMVWIKSRTDTRKHNMYDVVRGVQKRIVPNDNVPEDTVPGVTAFGTDGFTVGSETDTNGGSRNFVGWSWKAGAGQGSSNTDGSINTTYTSVNTTAGFSISKYTGTGANATVGHGLGVTPQVVIVKNLDSSGGSAEHWRVQHHKVSASKVLYLNLSNAEDNNGDFQSTYPTSSTFSISSADGCNKNGEENIAYCFAEKTGYSKFGSYVGNGNADGAFIYTGFKPAWVLTKETSNTSSWDMHDNKRDPHNVCSKYLLAEDTGAEGSTDILDFCSNGFKFRSSNGDRNESGATYIYMAFGQSLVGSNNIPCTAR